MSTKSLRRKWSQEKRDRTEFLCSFDRQVLERAADGSYTLRREPWKVWDKADEGR